jgi:hypothetical protein
LKLKELVDKIIIQEMKNLKESPLEQKFNAYKEKILKHLDFERRRGSHSSTFLVSINRLKDEIKDGKYDIEYIKPAFERNDSSSEAFKSLCKMYFGDK